MNAERSLIVRFGLCTIDSDSANLLGTFWFYLVFCFRSCFFAHVIALLASRSLIYVSEA